MPEERDIEKQLRAAAEQRRQEAGGKFELHPATRRLLHGEVQRVHGPKTTALGGRNPIFAGLWLRFAAGVCTVGILMVATWLMFFRPPPPAPTQLARFEPPRAAETAGYVQTASPLANRAPVELAKNKKAQPGVNAGFVQSAEPLAVPPAPAAPIAMTAAASGALAVETSVSNVRFLNNAAVAASGGRRADAVSSVLVTKAAENVAAAKAARPAAVLNSFQVEQRGDQLRIIDGDGSVYTGQLLAQAGQDKEAKLQSADRATERQVVADGFVGGMQNAPFTATGTNLSLKQNVIINAAFVNGSIVGHAVLADGQRVPLDAAPAPNY
ncbi:MAG: hypothetical protein NTZ16_02100 [Verrucomicrobia bacterium]|nr:hypothetical protein [Verrucomicrobiota bacterium]